MSDGPAARSGPPSATARGFRARLGAGDHLTGVVVRTPSHQVVEVLAARVEPDVVMIDTEHAAFDPSVLDATIAVARGLGVPTLVRVPELTRAALQQPLDLGATGVVVPHVVTAADAATAVRLAHYGDGGRGYSGSTRSAGWGGRPMADVVAEARATTTVVVQVEDPAAVAEAEAIAATPGIDAVFVGAADLAVAMGATSTADDAVERTCATVIAACARAGASVVAFAATRADAAAWRAGGVSCVMLGTDQARLAT